MILKFRNILTAAAIIAMAASCTSTKPEPEETVSQKITANVVDNGGTKGVWTSSDQIGVYTDKSEKNVKYTNTATKNAASASFKASTEVKGNPQYAYYPYSSANASKAATGLAGTLSQEQVMTAAGVYPYDYRYGVQTGTDSDENAIFGFHSLFANVCISVNASGTVLEGKTLENVICKVSRQGTDVPVAGAFTFSAADGSYTYTSASASSSVTASWKSAKTLGSATACYVTLFPTVEAGDVLEFTVNTADASAKVSVTVAEAFEPEGFYTFEVKAAEGEIAEPEVPVVAPELLSMKFTVADNPGKILGRKLTYSSSATTYTTRTEEVCTIDAANRTVSLYLPYFNNRTLVPVFELSEGATLTAGGEAVVSGETAVDFAANKEITVTNSKGETAVYTVNFTNTGLPVVVVNQQTGVVTSASGDTQKGSAAWYKATGAAWQPKDSDWLMTEGVDNFMVYNADGTSAVTDKGGATVDEPLLASTRVRGNVSQQMPKKPFAVKLDKKSGVLGMAPHKRWVLLANWSDRTLMRNAVAYDIAEIFRNTFTDGIAWSPSGQFVELVYNGVHVGNYYLCEQVKIDSGRLDIADPYDAEDAYSGNPADYGYLLECDDAYDETVKFITKTYVPFMFKDDADAGGNMLAYAKGIVNGIDDNLYAEDYSAAYETMDLASFVDFLLIQELMMNGELAYPKSVYTYIDGGKLYAGPLWDFDWQTIPNISVIESNYDNAYTNNGGKASYDYTYPESMLKNATLNHSSSEPTSVKEDKSYMWYPMLVKDATFKAMAAERWNAVKNQVTAYADTQIPAMAAKIKKSEAENWSMWKLESGSRAAQSRYSTYGVGGGFKGDEAMTFDNAVSTLSSNLNKRVSGMSYVSSQTWPTVGGSSSGSGSGSGSGNWWGSWWPW